MYIYLIWSESSFFLLILFNESSIPFYSTSNGYNNLITYEYLEHDVAARETLVLLAILYGLR